MTVFTNKVSSYTELESHFPTWQSWKVVGGGVFTARVSPPFHIPGVLFSPSSPPASSSFSTESLSPGIEGDQLEKIELDLLADGSTLTCHVSCCVVVTGLDTAGKIKRMNDKIRKICRAIYSAALNK